VNALQTSVVPDQPTRSTVLPLLPLAILEALRAQDRPHELLEDEDLIASLPRRFGLTSVVASQIQRYQEAARRGRLIPGEDVIDLFRLVLRRPDAREILRQAGCHAAQQFFQRVPRPTAAVLGLLPRAAAAAAARRATQKLLRRLHHPGEYEVLRNPWRARLLQPLTAGLDSIGIACTFYGAALEEVFFLYTGERPQITHSLCATLGASHCEWSFVG
jgi:hypothetical protein